MCSPWARSGLALAINGWYRPGIAFVIGGIAWVAVVALAGPAFACRAAAPPAPPAARRAHAFAAVGVAAIVAITAWNMANGSQHLLIDRDGGSYANTGRWIARNGSLAVHPRVGPFAGDASVVFDSPAVYQMRDGTLQFQFAHLLPAVLAEAYAIGGDPWLFHAPELLGGVALLAFFVLAWRLFRRPLFALSAMLALAFTIPQVSFSRDSYSEIPSQILLFTALWLLVTPRVLPRWRIALVAGLFLGTLEATRIDAIVFLIGVPLVCAVAWLRCDSPELRRDARASIVAFVGGLVPGLTLGLLDLTRHSGGYFDSLAGNVLELALLVAVSAGLCAAAVGFRRALLPRLGRLPWRALATGAGWFVALAGFGVWALRPRLQHEHGEGAAIVYLQQAEHVTVDATRVYFERSMSWMAWYLGPLTLAVAIVGAALLVRALLLGRRLRTLAALAVLLPGTLLYLYRANAVPDHVWITRRFLVSAMPTLVLLALGFAAYCAGARAPARRARAACRRDGRRRRRGRVPRVHARARPRDGRGDGISRRREGRVPGDGAARRRDRARRRHGRPSRRMDPAAAPRLVRRGGGDHGHARGRRRAAHARAAGARRAGLSTSSRRRPRTSAVCSPG